MLESRNLATVVQRLGGAIQEPGARFSKVPRLFGRISGDTVLFVSSKRGCLAARNFALILILFPLLQMKRLALQNEWVEVLRIALRAQKVFGTFEKRAPGARFSKVPKLFGHEKPFAKRLIL